MRLFKVDPEKESAQISFDWLTVIFKADFLFKYGYGPFDKKEIDLLLSELGFNKYGAYKGLEKIYTYRKAFTWSNGIICGYDEKTFMIQMSGEGVDSFEAVLKGGEKTLVDWLVLVKDKYGATFSRVDICLDLFNFPKEYSAQYVGEQAEAGNLITTSRTVKLVSSFSSKGKLLGDKYYTSYEQGFTTYIGRNPKQLRVYNKLAERAQKIGAFYNLKSWTRWEAQLNGEKAAEFLRDFFQIFNCDLSKCFRYWLQKNYRFIERVGHQAKRSRYPTATWYQKLVAVDSKIALVVDAQEKQMPTLEKQVAWIEKQVLPTVGTIFETKRKKYVQNGLSFRDAQELAVRDLVGLVEGAIAEERIDRQKVNSWLAEHKDYKVKNFVI